MKILSSILSFKDLKAFLKTPLQFKLVLLGPTVLLMLTLSELGKIQTFFVKSARQHLRTNLQNEKPHLLFLGSSRFYTGIDHSLTPPSSFTLSIPYANAHTLYRLLKANIDDVKKAQHVYVEFGLEMFCLETLKAHPNQFQNLKDLGVETSFLERLWMNLEHRNVQIIDPHITRFRLTPSEVLQNIDNKNNHSQKQVKTNYRHYGYIEMSKTLRKENASSSVKEHISRIKKHCNKNQIPSQLSYLKKIKILLRQHQLNFSFVKMPTLYEYHQKRQEMIGKKAYLSGLEVIQKHKLIDFMTSKKLDHAFYADANHLNGKGAQLVTRKILNDFKTSTEL